MIVRSRLFSESFVRALAVLGAAALTLTLLPAAAQAQQDNNAQAQQQQQTDNPLQACPVDAPEEAFADRADIPDAHIDNVDCAAFFGIVLGFANNEFRPSISVRRDQMASFIARTLDAGDVQLPAASEGEDFADVSADNPHRENIRRLEAAGVVKGGPLERSASEYGPTLPTRRDQMTSLIIRAGEHAYDQEFDSDTQHFDDVPSGNVHSENINFAAENDIVLGFDENTFGPSRFTRRDQMASFTVRLLNFLATDGAEVEITEQSAETATVGETITATATVFSQYRDEAADTGGDATADAGTEVTFQAEHAEATGVTVPPESQTVQTNEDGEAAFEFTSAQTGTVTVTASTEGPGGNFTHADGDSDTAQKEFVVGVDGEEQVATLNLEPPAETNTVGESHTVTATVEDAGGQPVEDHQVRLEVHRSDVADPTDPAAVFSQAEDFSDFTDANGQVTFTYTGPDVAAGDAIVACTEPEPGADVRDECTTAIESVDPQEGDVTFERADEDNPAVYGTATKLWEPQLL